MGLFDKITRGITRGIGNAIGNAAQRKTEEVLTPKINNMADKIAPAPQGAAPSEQGGQGLEQAVNRLSQATNAYATRVAQNVKVCPKCNQPTDASKQYCPQCGTHLPQATLAQSAVCTACGEQNDLTGKFCAKCGAKLPIAEQAEREQKQQDEQVLAQWQEKLSQYPVWRSGGNQFDISLYDEGYIVFGAGFDGDPNAAHTAVVNYRNALKQNGFAPNGSYPSDEHLYKQIGEKWYHVDTEHCFDGDADRASVGFDNREPYFEPPKKKKGLFGLFG